MKVYLTILEDRHADPETTVFEKKLDAMAFAKKIVKNYTTEKWKPEESEIAGWVYYCRLTSESDSVRIEEKTIQ